MTSPRIPPGPKAGIISLGCPKNLVDTEYLMGVLRESGWGFVGDPSEADLIVVNTCAFIEEAVRESREAVAEALAWKKRRGARVIVAGCLVNRFGRRLERDYPDADLFLRPGSILLLGSWLQASRPARRLPGGTLGLIPPAGQARALTTGAYAYLKISDGCDNRCHYCLIPSIRGRHRSRPLAAVVEEARGLIAAGAREINLVAQDITRWSGGRGAAGRLPSLVRDLAALPGDFRLRLLYLHPARLSEETIELVAGGGKVLPYADLPIQHASDRVLAAMNRPYTRRVLDRAYAAVRRRAPGAALRTTVMVGYPGEGKREFSSLLDFIAGHPFENLGAFVFSPQEGTPAALLPGRIEPAEARERYDRLMSLQADIAGKLWAGRVGRMTEALLLEPSGSGKTRWTGRTAWQAPEVDGLAILSGRGFPGEWAQVVVTGHGAYDLEGRIVPRSAGRGPRKGA